jgi:hypothetical protein
MRLKLRMREKRKRFELRQKRRGEDFLRVHLESRALKQKGEASLRRGASKA